MATAEMSLRATSSSGSVQMSATPAASAAARALSACRLHTAATSQPSDWNAGRCTCAPKPRPTIPTRGLATARLLRRFLVELEDLVQHAYRELQVLLVDHHRDLDLRGGDHLDVDALVGERLEHLRGNAHVRAHPDADDRYLADPVVTDDLACLEHAPLLASQHVERPLIFGAVHGEREV